MENKDFSEVYEVVNRMEDSDLKKIPNSFLKFIEDNRDSDYIFEYDYTKNLNEQNLSENSRLMISLMYLKYLAPDEEKKELYNSILEDKKRYEENTYKVNNIFPKEKSTIGTNIQNNILPINTNENKRWYKKIIDKIITFLKKFK